MKVLVTGATGYVGGRLVPRLLEAGHELRVLVRDQDRLKERPWSDQVEIVEGDVLEPETLKGLSEGVEVAFYLIHAMTAGKGFAERDRQAAEHFVAAMKSSSTLRHVIYMGGLLPEGSTSKHLASRAEVGSVLAEGLGRVTEFRAGPIIGSGSASFEMVRYLTERLPAMIAPKWVSNDVQPIAIRDVLSYLVGAVERDPMGVVEVGADVLPFREMMHVYASVRGLRRIIIPVPVLAPGLAARWVGLVTPISNRLAVPLVQGMTRPLRADTRRAEALFPEIEPIPYRRAVELALEKVQRYEVETHWAGALNEYVSYELTDWEGMIREQRVRHVEANAQRVFETFASLGGERGWLAWNWAWKLRGWLDQIIGGPGLRRGRRDPWQLLPGEALDWWRVERVIPGQLIRLRAEMKTPGRAWLEFEVTNDDQRGGSRLVQTATFAPRGFLGPLYWYLLLPLHHLIFTKMINAIVAAAQVDTDAPSRRE